MEEKKEVKVCPLCSNTEIAFAQNPLSKEPKAVPKFVPMACLGKACMLFNEEMKQCAFNIQAISVFNIMGKYLDKEKK